MYSATLKNSSGALMAQTNTVSVFVQMSAVTAIGVANRPEDCSKSCSSDCEVPSAVQVIKPRRNVSAFYLQCICLQRISGMVWRIAKLTYHSSVEWLIADVTDVSTLYQLSVFHAWVIVRLTLRYTTPDMRCRDRRDKCDGGIRLIRDCLACFLTVLCTTSVG